MKSPNNHTDVGSWCTLKLTLNGPAHASLDSTWYFQSFNEWYIGNRESALKNEWINTINHFFQMYGAVGESQKGLES